MSAAKKYRHVFGAIDHLKQEIPWTTGLANLVEFLVWEPHRVLGVSKKQYVLQIIEWTLAAQNNQNATQDISIIETEVTKQLAQQMIAAEQLERYSTKTRGICNAREALRRVKFFSEDYLNKEFDIFLSLCSDDYLDSFYRQFFEFNQGHTWSTHGNSGIFEFSTEIKAMAMDNLAYNDGAKVLIANELKLNGQKNRDQILKYALMFKKLQDKGFIDNDTRFLLLFIGQKTLPKRCDVLIEEEFIYCQLHSKKYSHLLCPMILKIAKQMQIVSITWDMLMTFNERYLSQHQLCQVEQKLLTGFNQSLSAKAFLQA